MHCLRGGRPTFGLVHQVFGRLCSPVITRSGSLPLPLTDGGFKKLAFALLAFVVVFNVGTYNYYRGSVVTPFHSGPGAAT